MSPPGGPARDRCRSAASPLSRLRRFRFLLDDQPAPPLGGLDAPLLVAARPGAGAQRILLPVDVGDDVARAVAEHAQARPRRRRDQRRPEVTPRARAVLQCQENVVVGNAASATFDLRIDVNDRAEEDEGLVRQVGTEVEQDTAARLRCGDLPPGLMFGESGAPALQSRLVSQHLAQLSLVQQTPQGQLIGVPAAIHERRDQDSQSLRLLHQRPSLGRGRGKRLVDHHRQAGIERSAGQVHVDVVGHRHHDEVMLRGALEDLRRIGDHLGIRMRFPRLGLALRVAGHHGSDGQARRGGDQGGVEDRPREPISDHRPSEVSHAFRG